MSFLLLMSMLAAIAWLARLVWKRDKDPRAATRFGAAGAFLFTGTDHFLSAQSRYLPMMPDFFGSASLPLIWFTGAAEIAGAVALIVPLKLYTRLKLPNLQYWAGFGLAVMLAFLVIANINVAMEGTGVDGINAGEWYFWTRPFFQPVIMLWVLYAAGVVGRRRQAANELPKPLPASR
jgi:uncharacterized membrane protein